MSSLLDTIASRVSGAAAKATTLAHSHLGAMLETAEIEYDESGRALIKPELPVVPLMPTAACEPAAAVTPDGALSTSDDVEAKMAGLLDEREELRQVADEQLQQLQAQLVQRLELAEERRTAAEARAQGAAEREDELEQKSIDLEARLSDEQAKRRAIEAELDELCVMRSVHAASANAASVTLTAAVEAEAERWRRDLEEANSRRAEAQRRREELEQEVFELSEAWQEALRQQPQPAGSPDSDDASTPTAASAAQAAAAETSAAATATMLRATLRTEHAQEMERAVEAARVTLRAELEQQMARAVASAHAAADGARSERDESARETDQLRVAVSSVMLDLAEQDACLARTIADARRAVEERAALKEQVQHSVAAASEQLQGTTREAANQVRDAEQRAASLARELEELKQTLESVEERLHTEARSLSAAVNERDAAQHELQKTRGELEALRHHLLDDEESSCQREGQLAERVHALEAAMADGDAQRQSADTDAKSSEARAARAEQALVSAECRNAEQAVALGNLQGLLEQMQLQAMGPGEELTQLRLGGRLLVTELRQTEADYAEAARSHEEEMPAMRDALDTAQATSLQQLEQIASLQALQRSAKAEAAQDASIDKRLVASLLVKYVELGCSDEVLVVLASMLGCSQAELQVLGLAPRAAAPPPPPDAKLSDMWVDYLLAEADGRSPSRSPR